MSFLAKSLKENAQSQQFVSFPVKNSKENAKKRQPGNHRVSLPAYIFQIYMHYIPLHS